MWPVILILKHEYLSGICTARVAVQVQDSTCLLHWPGTGIASADLGIAILCP